MRTFIYSARTAVLAGAVVLLSACSSHDPVADGGIGTVRVINASPGAVRVVVDGVTKIPSLSSLTVSQSIEVPSGTRSVTFVPIAGGSAATTDVSVSSGASRTMFASGGASALHAGVLADTGSVPAPGMSKLRVIHLAASAPEISVWRTQPDFTTPTLTMFPFPYMAESSFIQSTPGAWEVIVTPVSNGDVDPRPIALATFSLTIPADGARTVVILDGPDGIKLELLEGS